MTDSIRLWIAAATLHRERPGEPIFTAAEIRKRAAELELPGQGKLPAAPLTSQGLIANVSPSRNKCRFFYRESCERAHTVCLRLFRDGDEYHPERRNGRVAPAAEELPEAYRPLLDWYWTKYNPRPATSENDPILALRGVGKELWRSLGGTRFIEELRSNWNGDRDNDAAQPPKERSA